MFGYGSNVDVSKCVFQLSNYSSLIDFYNPDYDEIININDCVFDSFLISNTLFEN